MTPQDGAGPGSCDPEVEKGRLFFARPSRFVFGAARRGDFPPDDLPEFAMIGRSNVGKSSLINALTGRRGLARTSNTPGRTQQINFFEVGDAQARLVDLPGYGYAKASKADIVDWNDLIEGYFCAGRGLVMTCVLVDARHGFKDSDLQMMGFLGAQGVPFSVVLTKADKLPAAAQKKRTEEVQNELTLRPDAWPVVFLTSADKNTGIDRLRGFLLGRLQPEKE